MGYESSFTEKIYDNVYGFIYLTKEEKELLSTPYFQRLNHIRQLGLAYFVFPGAVHTRFSHSLGVLHIAEKMIQRLKKINYQPLIEKSKKDKYHKIVRLAALLHDIGHYPLSHTLEASYKECSYCIDDNKTNMALHKEVKKQTSALSDKFHIANEFKNNINSNNINKILYYVDKMKEIEDKKYHHENLAEKVIKSDNFANILKEKFKITDDDIDTICRIINGTNNKKEYFILAKIIKSNFDADQLDYMIRDTKNTGINVNVDLDYIINNMYVCKREFSGIKREVICYAAKAVSAIEQFLLSKYYWYSNILFYEKAYIVNYIARRIYSFLLTNKKIKKFNSLKDIEELIEKPEEFFFFNDSFFWKELEKIVLKPEQYPITIVKLSKMLINRQFPKLLDEKQFYDSLKNKGLSLDIQYQPSINTSKEMEQKIKTFKNAYIDDEDIVPVPIEKSIIKVTSEKSLGESRNLDSTKQNDKEALEISYLKNEDINVTTNNKSCRLITNSNKNNKQFLNLFFDDNKQPKCLHIFRLYDFTSLKN